MKTFQKFLDFVYGTVLIGGAPLAVFFIPTLIAELFAGVFHFRISDSLGMIIVGIFMLAAIVAFGAAAIHRARRRVAPSHLVFAEIPLGIILAVWFFSYYALTEHFIYD